MSHGHNKPPAIETILWLMLTTESDGSEEFQHCTQDFPRVLLVFSTHIYMRQNFQTSLGIEAVKALGQCEINERMLLTWRG